MLATIREFVEPLKPKTVIWMFAAKNDLKDTARESQKMGLYSDLSPIVSLGTNRFLKEELRYEAHAGLNYE